MRAWALWIVLIVAVLITSVTGWLALGIFVQAQTTCPDAFRCEDARAASLVYFGITVVGALIIAAAWRGLGSRYRRTAPK